SSCTYFSAAARACAMRLQVSGRSAQNCGRVISMVSAIGYSPGGSLLRALATGTAPSCNSAISVNGAVPTKPSMALRSSAATASRGWIGVIGTREGAHRVDRETAAFEDLHPLFQWRLEVDTRCRDHILAHHQGPAGLVA